MSFYRFPRVKFANENTVTKQLLHVLDEVGETIEALESDDPEHALEEMIDAIWSIETMIRIHCQETGLDPAAAAVMVEKKNRDRGYF